MTDEDRPRGGVHLSAGFGAGPRPAGLREVAALPRFSLIVVGDLGGAEKNRLVDITGCDIAEALAAIAPVAELIVPNRLGSAPATLAISLPVRALRDLDGPALAARAPVVVQAEAIAAEVGRSGSFAGLDAEARGTRFDSLTAELARQVSQPAPAAPRAAPVADNSLDALLSLVDVPGPTPQQKSAEAALSAFLAAGPRPEAAPRRAGQPRAIAEQIAAIATAPGWLRLEALWRGLKLLLGAQGRTAKPRIGLWDVARDDLADALASAAFAEAVAEQDAGWGAVLVLGAFGANGRDLAALAAVARAGAALDRPMLVSLDEGFFGRPSAEVAAMDNPAILLEGPAHAAWRSLRVRPESGMLFAAWNDPVLHAAETRAPLHGEPGLVVAAQALASLARTGWPTEILGADNALAGFDLAESEVRPGRRAAIPLGALLDPGLARDLAEHGLIGLACRADRDAVILARAGSAHDPGKVWAEDREAMDGFAGLPFRLVSGLLASVARAAAQALPRDAAPEEACAALARGLEDALDATGPGAAVTVTPAEPDPDGDAERAFEISVTLGADVMGGFGFVFELEC